MKKVLFVCLGNICRSPAAEAVFKHLVKKDTMDNEVEVDSAGIIGYHSGEKADRRMIDHAFKRGYKVESISRKFDPVKDFKKYDYIIGMDDKNISDLLMLSTSDNEREKIYRMSDFLSYYDEKEIPDPYYGGPEGFEHVLNLLEDGCEGILKKIKLD